MSAGSPRLFPVAQEQMTSDDHYTPPWVFTYMGIQFDLDVCAPPGGVDWIPATDYLTQADDGLSCEWWGRVWMNPPYSNPRPWVDRFIEHRHGVALVQVSKGVYAERLWNLADGIYFSPRDEVRFVTAEGLRTDIYMPLWFAAFGDECVEAISRLGVVRRIA